MSATADSVKVIENDKKIMRGEFRGDFTRDTFDPMRHFSRVLMQQGRVQVDADWNEQNSIILHKLRSLACDLGSEHWGPEGNYGFNISPSENFDFNIGAGHYYVKGLLCEVGDDQPVSYLSQPDYPVPDDQKLDALLLNQNGSQFLIYLDVWERHITYVNNDTIREVALGGPDTATRAKTVWQVKVIQTSVSSTARIHPFKKTHQMFLDEIAAEIKPGTGKLCARVKDKAGDNNNPCLVAPESRYRSTENQLYRVEIHHSGVANGEGDDVTEPRATYKWSRENASVIFPVTKIEGQRIFLEHLGRDCRYGLKDNDWVEIVDDDSVLRCEPGHLVQLIDVNREDLTVTVNEGVALPSYKSEDYEGKHILLRRWDQNTGDDKGIPVLEKPAENESWIDLEEGIQIQFKNPEDGEPHIYQTGDYWLIPARTATGDVEWPKDDTDKPQALLPHGVIHHYAPLSIITVDDNEIQVSPDLRRIMKQRWE